MEKSLLSHYVSMKADFISLNLQIEVNRPDVQEALNKARSVKNNILEKKQQTGELTEDDVFQFMKVSEETDTIFEIYKKKLTDAKCMKAELWKMHDENEMIKAYEECVMYNRLADLAPNDTEETN